MCWLIGWRRGDGAKWFLLPEYSRGTLMRALLGLVLFGVASAAAAAPVHYVDVVNDAKAGVAAFSTVMADGSHRERLVVGEGPLQANSATTLALQHKGGCRRDLLIDFADGRRMTVKGFDVCRNRSLHLRAALARAR